MLQSIVHVIKHTSFKLFRAYPAGVIWKKRQLMANLYTNKSDFLFVKRRVFPKNCVNKKKKISCVMFNKVTFDFLKIT